MPGWEDAPVVVEAIQAVREVGDGDGRGGPGLGGDAAREGVTLAGEVYLRTITRSNLLADIPGWPLEAT
jgi:hypothetical protein